ncbi:MAG: hypothetical protein ABI399_12020 [Bauldia sp.]
MAGPVLVRTLKHEYRIAARSEAALQAIAFMATTPEIAGAALEPVNLTIEERYGFFELKVPGGELVAGTASVLLAALHGLVWADLLESEAGSPIVHGATVLGPWGRALLVGFKTSGKTTLALHLIAAGFQVEGDEHLVIRSDSVIARPRTLRVKPGSLAMVPSLADAVRIRPFVTAWDGMPIYAVEPSIAGVAWTIAPGRLDRLVFVEPNHGGRSGMVPMPKPAVLPRLLEESLLPQAGVPAAFGRLRQLAMSVPAYRLSLGDLEGAQRCLLRLA